MSELTYSGCLLFFRATFWIRLAAFGIAKASLALPNAANLIQREIIKLFEERKVRTV